MKRHTMFGINLAEAPRVDVAQLEIGQRVAAIGVHYQLLPDDAPPDFDSQTGLDPTGEGHMQRATEIGRCAPFIGEVVLLPKSQEQNGQPNVHIRTQTEDGRPGPTRIVPTDAIPVDSLFAPAGVSTVAEYHFFEVPATKTSSPS